MNSTDELDNGRVKRALFGFPLPLSNNATNSTLSPLTNSSGTGPLGNVNPIPVSKYSPFRNLHQNIYA